jgi:hypothetical protein
MSTVSEDARVSIHVADYIAVDGGGKLNAIGLSVNLLGLNSQTSPPLSPPMYVAVIVEVSRRLMGEEVAFSIELRDLTADASVQVPMPPKGDLQTLRVQQMARVEAPNLPGVALPSDAPCRIQAVLGFQGLPLVADHAYEWRVSIDGQHRKSWAYRFMVVGPPPVPIIGGPAGPSAIPNLPAPPEDDEPLENVDET